MWTFCLLGRQDVKYILPSLQFKYQSRVEMLACSARLYPQDISYINYVLPVWISNFNYSMLTKKKKSFN